MRCPGCEHDNPASVRFCGACGRRMDIPCPACGATNPLENRFCHDCGAPLAPGPATPRFAAPGAYTPRHLAEKILTSRSLFEGERKHVTVLFADMKGSMEILADRDPEDARKLLDPTLELMMEAVHRYEGTVNQVLGDGIMAIFGAPLAHEDHAVRACYAALRMQEAIRQYSEEMRRCHGVEVQIRVGLHSGEVVVRAIDSDLHMDYTAIGQTTHLAARMEQLAIPGTVRLTGDTLRLAEGFVQVAPRGPVPVKGLPAPVEVFELVAAIPTRTRLQAAARRGLTRFVGRRLELAELQAARRQAASGRGRIVAVVGEPGVGKSRLFYEFTRSHHAAGWLVLESASVVHAKAAAAPPAVDLLRAYFAVHDADSQAAIREKVTVKLLGLDDALRGALPALLSLLDVPVTDAEWLDLDPTRRRQRTLDAIKHVVLREARRQPMILIVEDLHWIDPETQALLDSIVESLPSAPLLLLVNYRPGYQHGWAGKSYYTQLRVDPLPRENAGELLGSLLGDEPSLLPLRSALIERTDANPFFLEESVRTLVETGVLAGAPGAYRLTGPIQGIQVPLTVQAVLAGRIDRLSPEDKRLLQSMAVVGKEVPWSLLQAIIDLPESDLRRGLSHLQAGEFVHEIRLFPELEYAFRHSLTHEVAYEGMLHERRRALHARIVDAIEGLCQDGLGEHVERLAHHAVSAQRWDKAVAYASRAGAKALAHSAQGAAVAWYEQALAALDHLPGTRATIEQGIDLRLELRNALIPLGQFLRVLDVLRQVEELAVTLGDRRRLGLVYSFLTNYFQVIGDPKQGIEYGRRALALAEEQGDLGTEVVATAFLAQAHHILADYPSAIEHARRCIRVLRGERLYERFGMANLPSVYARVALVRSLAEFGEFGEAAAVAAEALRIAETADHPVSLTLGWFALGFVHLRRGEIDQAIPPLERAVELSRVVNRIWFRQVASALGSAYVGAGRVDEALTLLAEAEGQAASIGVAGSPLGHGARLATQAEALLAAGRAEEAAEVARRALDFVGAIAARGYQAWTERLLGAIAARREPPDLIEAGACYARALAQAGELGMRGLVARCHLEMGDLDRRGGRVAAATEHFATAAHLFHALGMTALAARAEAELAKEPT